MARFVLTEHDQDAADTQAEVVNDAHYAQSKNGGEVQLTDAAAQALSGRQRAAGWAAIPVTLPERPPS